MARFHEIPSSEITSESLYLGRREFFKSGLLFTATSSSLGATLLRLMGGSRADKRKSAEPIIDSTSLEVLIDKHADYANGEAKTPFRDASEYNNFYEFGTDKSDPAQHAGTLKPRPCTVAIEGEARPQTVDFEQLLRWFPLEERWFFSSNTADQPFSFETVCEILEVQPNRIRRAISDWRTKVLTGDAQPLLGNLMCHKTKRRLKGSRPR